MAREFPHTDVVGVDLAPVPIKEDNLPPNCHFEIDDINFGLTHFYNQFDVVHARLIGAGIKDFRKTVREAVMCLKPGGILLWSEPDYDFYTSNRLVWRPIASEHRPDGTWFGRIIWGRSSFPSLLFSDLRMT